MRPLLSLSRAGNPRLYFWRCIIAKRFTDTEKWKDNWYLSLSNDNRIVWQWLLDNCEHSGVIKRGVVAINLNCRTNLTEENLVEIMEGRLLINGGYYFIPKFLKFQYSAGLNSDKPVIKSVRNRLKELGIELLTSELYGNSYLTIKKRLHNRCLTIKDKDKDIIVSAKRNTPIHVKLMEDMKTLYETMTGNCFKYIKKDFVTADELIKKYGYDMVADKAKLLAFMCKTKSAWFTKSGWADFGIGKISVQWNSIIPEAVHSKELDDIKEGERIKTKWEGINDRLKAYSNSDGNR